MVALPGINGGQTCDIYTTGGEQQGCLRLYTAWVLLFFVSMAALAGLEMREQASFQVVMTAARLVVMVLMIGSVLISPATDFGEPVPRGLSSIGKKVLVEEGDAGGFDVPMVRWRGLVAMVPISVFCQLFFTGIPALLQVPGW